MQVDACLMIVSAEVERCEWKPEGTRSLINAQGVHTLFVYLFIYLSIYFFLNCQQVPSVYNTNIVH